MAFVALSQVFSTDFSPDFSRHTLAILQIIFINLLLGGDNAIAIAMTCRSLPPRQRRVGVWLGTSLGIGLRFAMVYAIGFLLAIPYMHIVAGLLLAWIGMQLLRNDSAEHTAPDAEPSAKALWRAVALILFADFAMSLDNGLATAAIAETLPAGSRMVVVLVGLAVGAPVIALGSAVMLRVIERFPFAIWLGAALLGWIAAEMLLADPHVAHGVEMMRASFGDGLGHDAGVASAESGERIVHLLLCAMMTALVLLVPFAQRLGMRRPRAG
ncbi:MAG: YjbE family putative metal transport protein [Paraburkholderia sp.]|jgi:YjbE family integral membrane protein|nr:YjbE family putative metal transport protein [Paraburkholderia sp.]